MIAMAIPYHQPLFMAVNSGWFTKTRSHKQSKTRDKMLWNSGNPHFTATLTVAFVTMMLSLNMIFPPHYLFFLFFLEYILLVSVKCLQWYKNMHPTSASLFYISIFITVKIEIYIHICRKSTWTIVPTFFFLRANCILILWVSQALIFFFHHSFKNVYWNQ